MDILLATPVGTETVERSFSQIKTVTTRLRSRLSDEKCASLLKIAVEGPELSNVSFQEILDIFKERNKHFDFVTRS